MNIDIVRAWKDATYRSSLSVEEQAMIPANPAGEIELSDAELQAVHGAHGHEGGSENEGNNTNAVLCVATVILAVCNSLGNECNG